MPKVSEIVSIGGDGWSIADVTRRYADIMWTVERNRDLVENASVQNTVEFSTVAKQANLKTELLASYQMMESLVKRTRIDASSGLKFEIHLSVEGPDRRLPLIQRMQDAVIQGIIEQTVSQEAKMLLDEFTLESRDYYRMDYEKPVDFSYLLKYLSELDDE